MTIERRPLPSIPSFNEKSANEIEKGVQKETGKKSKHLETKQTMPCDRNVADEVDQKSESFTENKMSGSVETEAMYEEIGENFV